MEFTVEEVTICRVAFFFTEALHQIDFLGIYEIFDKLTARHFYVRVQSSTCTTYGNVSGKA